MRCNILQQAAPCQLLLPTIGACGAEYPDVRPRCNGLLCSIGNAKPLKNLRACLLSALPNDRFFKVIRRGKKRWGFRSAVNVRRSPATRATGSLYGIADCAAFCSNFNCAARAQPCMTRK